MSTFIIVTLIVMVMVMMMMTSRKTVEAVTAAPIPTTAGTECQHMTTKQ